MPVSDLAILWHMVRGARGADHGERLEALYAGQAGGYDAFRDRFLHGRDALIERLDVPAGGRVVELGGGTGRNLEYFGERLRTFERATVVDLCRPLLGIAERRVAEQGWQNVDIHHGDATVFTPTEPVDCVFLSYSLTMIPDWYRAIDNALAMLRPGGLLGVVDFFVSRKHPTGAETVRHGAIGRAFWRAWFGHDDVFVNPDHIPYLHDRTGPIHCSQHRGRIPYVPLLRAPYFVFVGRKGP